MSTSTIVPLAYSCTKCWQMTCANSDQIGTAVPCIACSTRIVVPEATAKSIEAGSEFEASADSCVQPINFNDQISDAQIQTMAREKVREEMRASGSPEVLVCSRWKRLFGAIIDSIAGIASMVLGLLLAMAIRAVGGEGTSEIAIFAVMAMVPLMLCICQLYLIAVEGRTVGKYCVRSKIVNLNGQPPGFFQGIVMRIIVIAFLGMIPLFGLINICWIFNEPRRCLHDIIAGTYVIDA